MARASLPGFLAEVVDDRPAFRTLVASGLALAAAGLNPQVLSPFIVDVQSAIRAQPELLALSALGSVLTAGMLLIGGVAGDVYRTRRILEAALLALIATSAICFVVTSGPLFTAARIGGVLAAGLAIPFAIASVATAYRGTARATAIGFAYAAFGGGAALPPILLTITGPGGTDLPAYLACAAVAAIALWASRGIPDLPGASGARIAAVGRLAIWAFGVISLAAGLATVGGGTNPVRLGMIVLGIAMLGLAAAVEWRARRHPSGLEMNLRPVTVVLAAGLFIGFAQAIPMTILPPFFQVVLGFGPIFAVAALAPLFVALVVAGPIAGYLLPRITPRTLIGGGLVAVGLGDLVIGLVANRGASYLLFILPFVFVGAGFVIATTVRTAVIFASVPRDLPASAAALNEASVTLGSRIGIAVASVLLTGATLAAYAGSVPPGVDAEPALDQLRGLLIAIGTPSFTAQVADVEQGLLRGYGMAYIEGIRTVHLATGAIAVVAGVLAWVALGRRDPLQGMWEHQR
jgi:DHA2 family multidrug resistance protein-like MFS transporter